MNGTVDLNNQALGRAVEIDDEGANGLLTSKLPPAKPAIAQRVQKRALRRCLDAT